MQPEFMECGRKLNYPEPLLQKIWDDLRPFCGYAFNKSHAATYSYVAYQTAYLKANFPQEYMAAVMSAVKNPEKEFPMQVDECKRMGIEVLPPDVNKSDSAFVVEGKAIRWGLSQIKGCGAVVARDIELDRKQNGKYKSIFDMVRRLNLLAKITINKIALESLAKAGALDSLPGTRAQKLASVGKALAEAPVWKAEKQSAQMGLFGSDFEKEPALEELEDWSFLDSLAKEQKVLGVQISAHPLDEYYAEIKGFTNFAVSDKTKINELLDTKYDVKTAAFLLEVRERTSKEGKVFATLVLQDENDKMEAFCGQKDWPNLKQKLIEGSLILAKGRLKISSFNYKPQLMLTSMEYLEDKIKKAKVFHIETDTNFQIAEAEDFFKENKQDKGAALHFYFSDNAGYQYKTETSQFKISPTRENLKKLVSIFGKKNVWVSGE